MKKLLIIVDMVNGFINEGALADKHINKITPKIVELTKSAIKNNIPIIAFKDTHSDNDEEFKIFPPHCIKGTTESELIPELKVFENHFKVIEKNTTNGFNTKSFQNIVNNLMFEEVIIVGCCTDICVEQFATSYQKFNEENNRKTKLIVVEDAVYTFDAKSHNANTCHKEAIDRMTKAGITILNVVEKLDEKTY